MTHQIIGYFEADVLSLYTSNPHKYSIETDYFEGELKTSIEYLDELESSGRTDEYIRIRFGYHAKKDGDLCLTVFLPDLASIGQLEQKKWSPFIVDTDYLADSDERFSMWFDRNIPGNWNVQNGPRKRLSAVVEKINACCQTLVEAPLYLKVPDKSVSYPSSQNSHAYEDSHKNLYGFLIDSLSKKCLIKLATRREINIPEAENMKPPTLLRHVFAEFDKESQLHKTLSKVSTERGNSSHGVRNTAKSINAFGNFNQDLELAVESFIDLLALIENKFSISAEQEHKRQEAMKFLPKIIQGGIESNFSICQSTQMEGKSIEKVWYGLREENEQLHQSEVLFLQFTDGEILSIDTGSNVINIADKARIKPNEFHVDLNLTWVPASSKG